MQRETQTYRCYNCEKDHQITKNFQNKCSVCGSQAIQIITQEGQAQQFQTYIIPRNNNSQNITNISNHNPSSPNQYPLRQFISQIFNSLVPSSNGQISGFNINRILSASNHALSRISVLIGNIPAGEQSTAATQEEIEQLTKIQNVVGCSICQQDDDEQIKILNRGFQLKCGHCYHTDCIMPWFERTNTCPSCRKGISQ